MLTTPPGLFTRHIALAASWSRRCVIPQCCRWTAYSKSQALIVAHECSPIYSNVLHNVKGIAFLGVPHRGASIARLGSFFIDLLRPSGLGKTINSDLVKNLERNSDALSNISLQAVQRLKGLRIFTFYETRKMPLSVVGNLQSGL